MVNNHPRNIQAEFALKKIRDFRLPWKKVSQKAFYGIHVQFGFNKISSFWEKKYVFIFQYCMSHGGVYFGFPIDTKQTRHFYKQHLSQNCFQMVQWFQRRIHFEFVFHRVLWYLDIFLSCSGHLGLLIDTKQRNFIYSHIENIPTKYQFTNSIIPVVSSKIWNFQPIR